MWLAGWAVAVRLHRGPLAVDRWVDSPLVSASAGWQHASAWLLDHQTPGAMAVTAVVLGVVAARLGAWRSAFAAVAGVAVEMVLLQWVLKPLVDRHEIAPAPSFPSSYVGAVCALASVTVLLFRRQGPAGRWMAARGYGWASRVVSGLAVLDAAVVCVATIVTAGHLFSDVVAAIPWGVAVPVFAYWLVGVVASRRGVPLG